MDFRGPEDRPGIKGQYADVSLHAGLICVNGPVEMDAELQGELFAVALEQIGETGELINQVLEVFLEDLDGKIEIFQYELPEETT